MGSGEFSILYKIKDGIKGLLYETILLLFFGGALLFFFVDKFNIYNYLIVIYEIYNIILVYIYIGVTIVKLPKKMYLLSNMNTAMEYYQFKTNEKNEEIKENNNTVIEYFHKCKKSLKFINQQKKR